MECLNHYLTKWRQTCIQHNIKRDKQQKLTLKKTARLRSLQKSTILIRFNLLPVCPSVPTFVFAVLLIPSFNILSDYFYVSPNLVAVSIVRILIKFKIQLL